MEIAVWDTYVKKKDGTVMHFDIMVPESIKDAKKVYGFGREYLKKKGQEGQPLTAKECRLCHMETIRSSWGKDISEQGYYIYEMENCGP